MAYKVGSTVVIDDAGKIDWNNIKKPIEMAQGATQNQTVGSGNKSSTSTKMSFDANGGYHLTNVTTRSNCNCNCNSNCNCNCRC
jgi:hypothetical protein